MPHSSQSAKIEGFSRWGSRQSSSFLNQEVFICTLLELPQLNSATAIGLTARPPGSLIEPGLPVHAIAFLFTSICFGISLPLVLPKQSGHRVGFMPNKLRCLGYVIFKFERHTSAYEFATNTGDVIINSDFLVAFVML